DCRSPPAPQASTLNHSPTFVMRTLPSGCPRTETLSARAAAYKPERNRLRLLAHAFWLSRVRSRSHFDSTNSIGRSASGGGAPMKSSRLRKNSDSGGSGEGHDFSRAVKSFRFARALAPEVCFLRPRLVFPQPLQPLDLYAPSADRIDPTIDS